MIDVRNELPPQIQTHVVDNSICNLFRKATNLATDQIPPSAKSPFGRAVIGRVRSVNRRKSLFSLVG